MRPASIQVLCPTHGTGFVERLGTSLGKKKELLDQIIGNKTFNSTFCLKIENTISAHF